MVHWVGEKSGVVICLARDPAPLIPGMSSTPSPSSLFVSYDDGDKYENRTEAFKGPDGKYATLDKFYNHPKFNNVFVFTDIKHNVIYVTSDHGRKIERREVMFSPSEISFHEAQSGTFLVLDKNSTNQKLWITEDFGKNFRVVYEFVKSFYLFAEGNGDYQLIVQRMELNNLSSVLYYKTVLRRRNSQIYATGVKDLFFKGDYLFTTRYNSKGDLELYVSYKLGKQQKCAFSTSKKILGYFVVDVTETRALIAASHSNVSSNLYVSENLGGSDGEVRFGLSLKDVFAFIPGMTWQNTWLNHLSEDAFADVYKVEGPNGIYIASKLTGKVTGSSLGPQHLSSVITFDHGATWRPIRPPALDVDGRVSGCAVARNCSLHLSQKFGQLFPETRTVGILSSKSAPGIIMATGVLGKTLKGHYGVYISTDSGLTWRQTLRDLHFFNMGDHGGLLSAVRYYKSQGVTRHIEYSTDEGATWNETAFHVADLKLYGLMTEPGENTTVFTMFGSLPEEHQWIVVKVDLKGVFNRSCVEDDYKMWSPGQSSDTRSYIPCLLGQQTTYQRRIPHARCLNGLDYVRVVAKQPCNCDIWDFECDFGFIKVDTPHRCIHIGTTHDPQKVPANCKPGRYYNRTKGYVRIAGDTCVGGFESHYLPDLVPCPIKQMDDFLLFAQRERISRYNLVTKKLEELPITNLKNVIAIDFDMAQNCVYWADIAEDTIGRQCYSNGSKMEILVSTELSSIEGMAFDWISKTLYFVDGVRAKIELIRTDVVGSGHMRRTILNSTVLNKPRGIVLHPQNGYLFWTDWSADNPSISRANLDGTHNLTLFGAETVEWPNGITIDYMANRLYWVDARLDYIGSSDLHGDDFVKIISDNEVVSHPFAVAVFKNTMFWDDWKRNSIFSGNKDYFKGVDVVLKQMPGLMDLKVFAHGLQIGTNACTNTTCAHICVGLPHRSYACLCPDGLAMHDGACVCPGGLPPFANLTCPSAAEGCSEDQFTCANRLCVPKGWRCDREDDCGDGSDEARCVSETCPPTFFGCADGKCLPHYWRCDFDKDCADGSDEMGCSKMNCTENQFSCENGLCISMKWKCDGENDCRDGSDERNCSSENPTTCKNDEFHCKTGGITCIPVTWKCDTEPDCGDGSDELDCANNTCSEAQMSCGAPQNKCIYNSWMCDGDRDCPDGRDELNCTTSKAEQPKMPNDFLSKNGSCQDWMFVCNNSRCIPFWWKCDGVDDCLDNSDEVGCSGMVVHPTVEPLPPTVTPQSICESNQFHCSSGDCIDSSWVCDGTYDCLGGEDENNCNWLSNCSSKQFKCQSDGSCVSLSAVCNGIYECPDGTDELSCDRDLPAVPAAPSCSRGLFACDSACYPLSYVCDGKIDCRDGTDEGNCTKRERVYQVMQLDIDERGTNDTSLFLLWWIHLPDSLKLEFQPSIKRIGDGEWKNGTWTTNMWHQFTGLEPYTKYNMTVYVRIKDSNLVFPPAIYNVSLTSDGTPSEPWNLTAKQRNGSHILVAWKKPQKPRGPIVAYEIVWKSEKAPEVRLKLTGNETSHLLSPDFEHGVTYTFWVIAYNRKSSSNKSEPAKLRFDGETNVSVVSNFVVKETDETISFSWDYAGEADGFNVRPVAGIGYPELPTVTTKTRNVTMRLAPGVNYRIEVNAFKKTLVGPTIAITIGREGKPLPEISISQAIVLKVGTTVKLSWERPKYVKKLNWMYGIYYGTNHEQLFEKPRFITPNETATISDLEACEAFIFSVGIVGPIGYGPLSGNFKQLTTSGNAKAPPKRIQVGREGDDPLQMRIQWVPACPTAAPEFYSIQIRENATTQTWHRRVNATELYRVFSVSYGGVYEVKMASGSFSGPYSKPVTYTAPSIQAPYEVRVLAESNGSYIISWKESSLPSNIGKYQYEVLVHEGNTLDEKSAQKFEVDKPPFVYTNGSFDMFTFAVRIRTGKGLRSVTSEAVSKEISLAEASSSSSMSVSSVVACSVIIVSLLLTVIVVLMIRFRRLQGSFTRFTNTHYDTRSQAATFDERTLEEDECPQIRGFSDDEPLVIA
ncbi:unnamed protein product [Phaedon cochleariae]|uniref:Sortilin-related receptor n=1 Tax=Phaedon cochleariae TaxID=80249 RepID=A0A9N9SMB2_PHACE|nr:unnamed protein product [Phaedon cochleariae]